MQERLAAYHHLINDRLRFRGCLEDSCSEYLGFISAHPIELPVDLVLDLRSTTDIVLLCDNYGLMNWRCSVFIPILKVDLVSSQFFYLVTSSRVYAFKG